MKEDREVICPFCKRPAQYVKVADVNGHDIEHGDRYMWICHDCSASVLTHLDSDKPLGTMAKPRVRNKRRKVHAHLDILWKTFKWDRDMCYSWLAVRLGIPKEQCHVAQFDEDMCDNALRVLHGLTDV